MCGCPVHNDKFDQCTCLCEEHDALFDNGTVVVRKAIRRQGEQIYYLQQDMGRAMTAIKENTDAQPPDDFDHLPKSERGRARRRAEKSAADYVKGLASSVDRLIDRMDAVEERLSPPETRTGSKTRLSPEEWQQHAPVTAHSLPAQQEVLDDETWQSRAIIAERKLENLKRAIANA